MYVLGLLASLQLSVAQQLLSVQQKIRQRMRRTDIF
jgi:hypothetical protein